MQDPGCGYSITRVKHVRPLIYNHNAGVWAVEFAVEPQKKYKGMRRFQPA